MARWFRISPRAFFLATVVISILATLQSIAYQVRHELLAETSSTPIIKASLLSFTNQTVIEKELSYELCFLTSVFANNPESADRVGDVTELRRTNPTFQYLLFTNLEDYEAPGWKIITIPRLPYQRTITQSRWAKFVPWQHNETSRICPVIFYMDGFTLPKASASALFQKAAKLIKAHSYGLGQFPKRGSRILKLAKGLVQEGKDTAANVNYTITWLQSQPDFRKSCTVYLNRHIGIDPRNPQYQRLSSYFWELYSAETGSWRDQLLWCYVVDKFQAQPVNLHQEIAPMKHLFEEHRDRMGYNGHTYVQS